MMAGPPDTAPVRATFGTGSRLLSGGGGLVGGVGGLGGEVVAQEPEEVLAGVGGGAGVAVGVPHQGASPVVAAEGGVGLGDVLGLGGFADVAAGSVGGGAELGGPDLLGPVAVGHHHAAQ